MASRNAARMRDDLPRLRAAFLEAIRYISLLAFPLLGILAVVAEPFVVVLFGEQWRPSGDVLAVMMLWILPLSLFEPCMELFKAVGRPGLVLRLAIVKFGAFAGYLALLWGLDQVTLVRVAAGLGLSTGIGLAATLPHITRETAPSAGQLWRAVRPALGAGIAATSAGRTDRQSWPTVDAVSRVMCGSVAAR